MMTDARSALPVNARRWLDRALPAEAPSLKRITNRQTGQIQVRDRWLPFTAETVYEPDPFSFLWRARLKMLPGVWVAAEDGHDGQKGWGGSKLWGIVPMGGRTGPEVFRMQLVRSLAELPWMPQFALAIPGLEWSMSGDEAFEIRASVGDEALAVRFELNAEGDIIQASGRRHYDVPDGFVEVPWRVAYGDHRAVGQVRMPTSAAATYEQAAGPWTYWKARISVP
jgi:hypothetical protein